MSVLLVWFAFVSLLAWLLSWPVAIGIVGLSFLWTLVTFVRVLRGTQS